MNRVAPPSSAPVVRLQGVSLNYRKAQALRDIDLDIPAGVMAGGHGCACGSQGVPLMKGADTAARPCRGRPGSGPCQWPPSTRSSPD